jgi:hypothetical protein
MRRVAELIDRALTEPNEDSLATIRGEVEELTAAFPLYTSKPVRPAFDGAKKARGGMPVGAHQ